MGVDDCPAGWYITTEMENNTYYNVYYHPDTDASEVPQTGWAPYKGQYSKPGFRPLPEARVVSDGCHPHRDSDVCLCHDWCDMEAPHWHKAAPVDWKELSACLNRSGMELTRHAWKPTSLWTLLGPTSILCFLQCRLSSFAVD